MIENLSWIEQCRDDAQRSASTVVVTSQGTNEDDLANRGGRAGRKRVKKDPQFVKLEDVVLKNVQVMADTMRVQVEMMAEKWDDSNCNGWISTWIEEAWPWWVFTPDYVILSEAFFLSALSRCYVFIFDHSSTNIRTFENHCTSQSILHYYRSPRWRTESSGFYRHHHARQGMQIILHLGFHLARIKVSKLNLTHQNFQLSLLPSEQRLKTFWHYYETQWTGWTPGYILGTAFSLTTY